MDRKKSTYVRLLYLVIPIIILAACTQKSPTPSPSPQGTPTRTPTPTALPSPTPTPTPSPEDLFAVGQSRLRESDFAGAAEAYDQAIEIDESFGLAYSGLSQVYLFQNIEYADVLALAEKGAELSPDSATAHALLAEAQLEHNQSAKGLESARTAAELAPEDPFVQSVLAQALIRDKDYESALEAAENAYALDMQSADALIALADYYFSTADFERALAALEKAASLEPQDARWKVILGDYWIRRERYAKAAEYYQAALDIAPDYLPAVLGMAFLETSRQDFELAQDWLEKADDLSPGEPDTGLTWSFLYRMQEKYDEATEQVNQVLDAYPEHYLAMKVLAGIYLEQDECNRADREFQDLESVNPQDTEIQLGRGFSQFCSGDINQGLTHFRKGIEKDPYDSYAHLGLGLGLLYQERWDDSLDEMLKSLQLSPDPSLTHARLAYWFVSQGMYEEAEAELRLALRLNPYSSYYHTFLGDILIDQERYTEALELANSFRELDDTDLEIKRVYGTANYFLGNNAEALDAFEQVLEDDPEYDVMHLFMALTLRNSKDFRLSEKEIKTYRALVEGAFPEETLGLLAFLEMSLSQNYYIPEAQAIEMFNEYMETIFGSRYEASVQDLEDGRTFVMEVPVSSAEIESGEFFTSIGAVMYVSSLIVPRVDPAISNGTLARVVQRGETIFTIAAPLSLSQQFADTLIESNQFFEKWEYSMEESSVELLSTSEVQRNTSELRELESTTSVPFETLTKEEVQDEITGGIDEEVRETLLRDEALLEILGVIAADTDLEQTLVDVESEQVAGFYDPDEDTFYLVEQEESSALDQVVIAHEYTHALQDQSFGLDPLDDAGKNDDQKAAYEAFIEGDAMLSSILFMEAYVPVIDRLDAATKTNQQSYEALENSPDFIQETMAFPYIAGLEFVQWLYDRNGWDSVNEAYANPPNSTEQIIHPQRYMDDDQPMSVSLPDFTASLEDGWVEADNDVFGELVLRLFIDEHLGPAAAQNGAEGWGGDRYILLANDEAGDYVLVMRVVWDDQDESDEFWSLYRRVMEHRAGFQEVVDELVGDLAGRWWTSEESGIVYASQKSTHVYVVMGTDREAIEQIIAQLP